MRVSPPSPTSQPDLKTAKSRTSQADQNTRPAADQTDQAVIRNFCVIAHIDHGKSTLADRMLQLTGVVEGRQMRAQYLDRMDIERELGITIKSQAVRLPWTGEDGQQYVLNLIDTPGHVDFSYEVSRSLAACEGAVLLVDAAQGIEAQTLANLYLALGADLKIIPVLNKIDLPAAQPDRYAAELAGIIGCDPSEVLRVSAKTGEGVEHLLHEIVRLIPAPRGNPDAPARALIFDSIYDTYRGVVTYVRVVDGRLTRRERSLMMSTGSAHETLEVGVISPEPLPSESLAAGEVGYLITGVKDVRQARVGDTVTSAAHPAEEALAGYERPRPWSSPVCTRWTATITRTCATRWTSRRRSPVRRPAATGGSRECSLTRIPPAGHGRCGRPSERTHRRGGTLTAGGNVSGREQAQDGPCHPRRPRRWCRSWLRLAWGLRYLGGHTHLGGVLSSWSSALGLRSTSWICSAVRPLSAAQRQNFLAEAIRETCQAHAQ